MPKNKNQPLSTMPAIVQLLASLPLLTLINAPLNADVSLMEPLAISNRNPLIQVFGLPSSRGAGILARNSWSLKFSAELANSFRVSSSAREELSIDAESYRMQLDLRWGIAEHWEIGVQIPYVGYYGGVLDDPIEQWHDLLKLPNGDRDTYAQDEVLISYARDGQFELQENSSAQGVGDISFDLGYQFALSKNRSWNLRAGMTLPSGQPEDLTGSGAASVFSALHFSDAQAFHRADLSMHFNAGLLVIDEGDVIDSRQNATVWYGSLSFAWRIHDRMALKAQLDGHTAFYDSALKELGEGSLQLVLGASVRLDRDLSVDLSFSEDVHVGSSPDIVLQLGLTWRPQSP